MSGYDPEADPVHGGGWNSAARWGGWDWRKPRYGDHFRTCSFCGSAHPGDLAAEAAGSGPCRVCGGADWEACFRKQPLGVSEGERQRLLADPSIPEEEKGHLRAEYHAHSFDPGGWYASWADRKYGWPHKFYVEGLRPHDPSLLHCVGHGSGGDGSRPDWGDGWVEAKDLTRAQKKIIKADGMHAGAKFEGWYQFAPRTALHAKFYTAHLADPRIPAGAVEAIAKASGLRFTFEGDGTVRWGAYEPAPADG